MLLALALLTTVTASSRQTIDLDQGWEYVRVPNPPSIWSGVDVVPTSTWRVVSVSSEERDQEDGKAANAFDGNPKTIWHTEWSKKQTPYPHELVVDLGSRVETVGIRLLPRQTPPNNGRPNHFELYLANDPQAWGAPILSDTVPDSTNLYTKHFPVAAGRYMRLVFKDGHRPQPFLALSEIGLIRQVALKDQKDWASQYNIANVQVGSARFDLNPDALEQTRASEIRTIRGQKWSTAALPHAAWIRPLPTSEIWQGVTYYRRMLRRPAESNGKLITLTLEGAMQSSDVWLNGKHVGSRRGGYLPLVADVTPWIENQNEILVRVDNRDNPLIPPGKPQQEMDFMYGNGIYRNAWLTITDKLRITDSILENLPKNGGIYVTFPDVASNHATVRVRTHIRNAYVRPTSFTVKQTLRDSTGRIVAAVLWPMALNPGTAEQILQDLVVLKPRLWSPDAPNLYKLTTSIDIGQRVVDEAETQVGIRKIEVSRKRGFVLNGKPIRLIGTNRHQDYPWVGPALSNAANIRDGILIRQAGHNIVRLSHYPQSPEFLDACDRIGLMVIPCIPGWQFMNSDPRFEAKVSQDIRELIRRDRNHPCTAFWETSLNETYPPARIARQWDSVAKSESYDGTILTAGDAGTGAPWDVAYNQWKEDLSRPQDAAPDKPGYIREYGDYEFGGAYSSSRVRIGDGIDKLLKEAWNHVWSYNKFRPQYPWTMGAGTWEMFDTNVPWEFKVSACGLADFFRRPKPSFWFFASQEATKPMLKIAATWQPGVPTRDVVVFTNCDEARLSINGREIAAMTPERGKGTAYDKAKPFDGSNALNLVHPPIVFRNVPFAIGRLSVSGLSRGKETAKDTIETASEPVRLKVWIDDLGVAVQRNDLVFVRAAIVDAQGRISPIAVRKIDFKVSGSAQIAGEGKVVTEMGVASILVRTSSAAGSFSVGAATQEGLAGYTVGRFR